MLHIYGLYFMPPKRDTMQKWFIPACIECFWFVTCFEAILPIILSLIV